VPQVLVLLRQGGGATLAATVNAHSGELLSQRTLQQDVCQVPPACLATSLAIASSLENGIILRDILRAPI
jgi:hypothetical protein